jgi:hypothetical protein
VIPTVALLTLGVFALAVMPGAWFYRARRARLTAERSVWHCRCPACDRKLRYRVLRASCQAVCPFCKRPFTLPALPPLPSDLVRTWSADRWPQARRG